jgi:hypothetical protein
MGKVFRMTLEQAAFGKDTPKQSKKAPAKNDPLGKTPYTCNAYEGADRINFADH